MGLVRNPNTHNLSSWFVFFRTADDSAAVGTVVVSHLKMGEIEDGGVDHIATDAHQKVTHTQTQRLLC